VEAAAKREEREKEKAEKDAKKAAEKAAQNTQKPIPTSQKGKRKALTAASSKPKRQKRSGKGRAVKLPTQYTQSN
jgi:hypothetical protein